MDDELLARARADSDAIPDFDDIYRIFWFCFSEAQHTFGPCAPGWVYRVDLRQSLPYAETVSVGHGRVIVGLTEGTSWLGFFFEAAHEVVHCLNPVFPSGPAMHIEEAIACGFSLEVVRRIFGQSGVDVCTLSEDYRHAMDLASEIDTDLIRLGQRLRKQAKAFERVTFRDIRRLYPHAPEQSIVASLNRFPRPLPPSQPPSP